MLVDSHCHIDFDEYADRIPQILDRMAANQVTHALCASVNLTDFPKVLSLAEGHSQLFASVGTHPDHDKSAPISESDLIKRAAHPKVVAIGAHVRVRPCAGSGAAATKVVVAGGGIHKERVAVGEVGVAHRCRAGTVFPKNKL